MALLDDYGRDTYIRRDGVRLRTAMVRTIRPGDRESNAAFLDRMDTLVDQLQGMPKTLGASYETETREGRITLAVITVAMMPHVSPIAEPDRAAGGRPSGSRGQRAA